MKTQIGEDHRQPSVFRKDVGGMSGAAGANRLKLLEGFGDA